MSDNWIVVNLENAFSTWNDKMAEIWSLVTTSPQNNKGVDYTTNSGFDFVARPNCY